MKKQVTIKNTVDMLAEVLAKKAELEKKEKELKAKLIREGVSCVEGKLFKANVIEMPGRESVDIGGLCEFAKIGEETLRLFKKVGNPFYVVKLVSK